MRQNAMTRYIGTIAPSFLVRAIEIIAIPTNVSPAQLAARRLAANWHYLPALRATSVGQPLSATKASMSSGVSLTL